MDKRLSKHGNSWALIVERPIMELLNITEQTPLNVSTDGRRLIIEPANTGSRRKKFEAAKAKSHKRFANVYKKLAE